jgi:hypothetical protein
MTVFAVGSDSLDVHLVGDALDTLGWHADRQQSPPSLHFMVTPAHTPVVDDFIRDLREAARMARDGEVAPGGRAAVYGALEKMDDKTPAREAIFGTLEKVTTIDERQRSA